MPLSLALQPNKMLLQSEFEGYKLTLRDLPHYSHELEMLADRVYLDGVHANIFGPHNHLVVDPWDNGYSFYYVDQQHRVHHIAFDGRFTFQDRIVYEVPTQAQREHGVCLTFADINLVVMSDAVGYLFIVDTGNRTKYPGGKKTWSTVNTSLPLGDHKSIVVVDCKIQESGNVEVLHCLVQSVERKDVIYNSVISWVVYEQTLLSSNWQQVSYIDLKGKGKVYYAALESSCDALYVASDSPLKITRLTANSKVQQTNCSSTVLQSVDADNDHWSSRCDAGAVKLTTRLSRDTATNLQEASAIVRVNAKSLEVTHSIPLEDHQYLFDIKLENSEAPALVLRHDKHACIWQPYTQLVDSEMWPVKHQGTLMAFGYLQSAKNNRKFITCSPNLSYGVMCDGNRHIFIYENDNNPIFENKKILRKKQLEQEHIFNMEEYGEILGISAANNFLFALTQTHFVAINVKQAV